MYLPVQKTHRRRITARNRMIMTRREKRWSTLRWNSVNDKSVKRCPAGRRRRTSREGSSRPTAPQRQPGGSAHGPNMLDQSAMNSVLSRLPSRLVSNISIMWLALAASSPSVSCSTALTSSGLSTPLWSASNCSKRVATSSLLPPKIRTHKSIKS